MIIFELLTGFIGLLTIFGFLFALLRVRDVFHPLAYLMPMVAFIYVLLPYEIWKSDLFQYSGFSVEDLVKAQSLNVLCVLALVAGCFTGARPEAAATRMELSPMQVDRVFWIACVLGSIGILAYLVNLNNVGGLFEAYSVEKGGGTAESGYTRDAIFWSVSGLALITVCLRYGGPKPAYLLAAAIFIAPMLIHGILGARRGPSFIALSALAAVYYFGFNRRPRMTVFLGGGLILGFLLLMIVNFRDEFRLGSNLFQNPTKVFDAMFSNLGSERVSSMERTLGANEFMYGVDVVTRFGEGGTEEVYWGRRILTIALIRPIPSSLWLTKYEDVGMDRYLSNVGLGGVDDYNSVAFGAAPGFIADLFAEFSWGAIIAVFLIGRAYCRMWRNALDRDGIWLALYVICIALSIFLVAQTIEAILYRILLTSIPLIVLWRLLISPRHQSAILEARSIFSTRSAGE